MLIGSGSRLVWSVDFRVLGLSKAVKSPSIYLILCFVLSVSSVWGQDAPVTDELGEYGYQLGPADQLYITVFNHTDLTGEFVLDGDGRFAYPLIGMVTARGLTLSELEDVLVSKLKPDYLVNPRISIKVGNYRPYYLIGEVKSTGSFSYVQGITYLTAIAMAGGYAYRAKKDVVYVIRGNDPNQEEVKLDANEKVQPGDIIRVAERMF